MKTLEIEQLLAATRRLQLLSPAPVQLPPHEAQPLPPLPADIYENIVVSIINFCQTSQLSARTHALAKSYLDCSLERRDLWVGEQVELVAMICIWRAVEVNEPREKSILYNANTIHLTLNGLFQLDQIQAAKSVLAEVLQAKTTSVTAFDYVQPFFQGFSELAALKQQMPDIIDFGLSLHALKDSGAEELFFGALMAEVEISGWVLTAGQRADIGSLIVKKADCEAVREKIVQEYNKVLADCQQEDVAAQFGL